MSHATRSDRSPAMPPNSLEKALFLTLKRSSSTTSDCDMAAPMMVFEARPPPASQKGTEKAPAMRGAPPVTAVAVHAPTPASHAAEKAPELTVEPVTPALGIATSILPLDRVSLTLLPPGRSGPPPASASAPPAGLRASGSSLAFLSASDASLAVPYLVPGGARSRCTTWRRAGDATTLRMKEALPLVNSKSSGSLPVRRLSSTAPTPNSSGCSPPVSRSSYASAPVRSGLRVEG
mmetsp:Transcript_12505/g.31425  ORF Transcript_12505/g.31425 Transcript_12505/m.31425 type:complete len:235 (-) Transcript_12505:3-707(-)